MNKIWAIMGKELKGYFYSSLATIVLGITISVFNIFFYVIIDEGREATLRDIFKIMEFMFVFIIPILTMKTFSEEKTVGTLEFLMTSPISNTAIVLGKYAGSLAFFTLIIIITLPYYLILEIFSNPDRGAVALGFLGIWLEGALFISIGIMTSSWTRNQLVSAMCSYVILFLLYFSIAFIKYFQGLPEIFIRYIGTWSHMENLSAGLLSLSDIVYYLTGIIFCLLLTRLTIENRLWR